MYTVLILTILHCEKSLFVLASRQKIPALKGLSHEIDFKNFDQNLKNLAYLRDATGV
jgi:hypothetical protein